MIGRIHGEKAPPSFLSETAQDAASVPCVFSGRRQIVDPPLAPFALHRTQRSAGTCRSPHPFSLISLFSLFFLEHCRANPFLVHSPLTYGALHAQFCHPAWTQPCDPSLEAERSGRDSALSPSMESHPSLPRPRGVGSSTPALFAACEGLAALSCRTPPSPRQKW